MTKGTVTRMIYTPKTKQALKLCFEAHKNQVDKSGMPYVFHPFHVAEQMKDETSSSGRHRAASHVAGPLDPRGQLTPAPCIQLS